MAKAPARGKWLENRVAEIADEYRIRQLADIEKVDPPTRVVSRGRFKQVIMLASPFLDFHGTWTARAGRSIVLEAKETEHARLPIDVASGDGITAKQWHHLQRWDRSGAATGILWARGTRMRLATLDQCRAAMAEGRRSMEWRHAYRVPPGEGLVTHDFLAVLDALNPAPCQRTTSGAQ